MTNLFIFLGRSASGKTTITKDLMNIHGFKNVQNFTTRKKRECEVKSEEYKFISAEEFNRKKFSATFVVNDEWKYGVGYDIVDKEGENYIFSAISLDYAYSVFVSAKAKGINVKLFILDISDTIRIQRMLERGDSEESISRRLDIEKSEGKYDSQKLLECEAIHLSVDNISNFPVLEYLN